MNFRIWDVIGKRMLEWGSVMHLPAEDIFPGTPDQRAYVILRSTEKSDRDGKEVFEGDIIENLNGIRMKIQFGTYPAWCPVDMCYMDSVGFYAETEGMPKMPIGNPKIYGKVVGNIFEDPELMDG